MRSMIYECFERKNTKLIIAGILGYSDVGLLVVKEYLHYILTKFKIISWSQYTFASMITSIQAVLAGFCKSSLVTS